MGREAGITGSAADFLPPRLSLPALKQAVQSCRGCDLCCQAGVTQAVFGDGPAGAKCILVGEQPGEVEDREGLPFVGPAGRLMDELLQEAGLDRRTVYVTNAVKHFRFELRGKRRIHQKPLARHISACRPWFEAEVELLRAKMVVALGATAAQAIMGRDFLVTKQRGKVMSCPYAPWFLATIHPSAILRAPDDESRREARAMFVKDMEVVASQLSAA
jgi:DNA polymerase